MVDTHLAIFKGKLVRKTIHDKEWWFSVVDIVKLLIDQPNELKARKYWNKLAQRLREEGSQVVTFCHQLKLVAADGKLRKTDCANTESLLRVIQSIPSPKAESLKRWLARVGYERVQEIEDPELATKRTRFLYKAKGYPDSWIEKRIRGINIREELTDEWRNREIQTEKEYAILTAEISKATFDMTPSEYKKFKRLKRENLRDHMDGLELIFSMLGEASTTRITTAKNAIGFKRNEKVAREGGKIAGNARRALERKSGKKVSTRQNYLKGYKERKLISS